MIASVATISRAPATDSTVVLTAFIACLSHLREGALIIPQLDFHIESLHFHYESLVHAWQARASPMSGPVESMASRAPAAKSSARPLPSSAVKGAGAGVALVTGASSGIAAPLPRRSPPRLPGVRHRPQGGRRDGRRDRDAGPGRRLGRLGGRLHRHGARPPADGSTWVNNAGYLLGGAVEEASLEQAKAQFETNFFGAFRVSGDPAIMRGQASGRIVNVTSLAGVCRCRSGVLQRQQVRARRMTETLRYETSPFGIKVSAVEAGMIRPGSTPTTTDPTRSPPTSRGVAAS